MQNNIKIYGQLFYGGTVLRNNTPLVPRNFTFYITFRKLQGD